jgi:hypothetical protein
VNWDKFESGIIITPRSRVLCIGKVGTGKSTRRKGALANAMRAGQRRIISLDVLDEDSIHGRKRKSVELGPLTRRMTMEELAKDLDVIWQDEICLAVVPMEDDPGEWAEDLEALLDEVKQAGDCILSLPELGMYAEFCTRRVNQAFCLARHWGDEGVGIIADAQRATGVPYTARTQASDIVSGLQDMPADIDALRERCGERFGDEVSTLSVEKHEYRHWRDTDGRWERAAKPNKGKST